MPQNNSRKTGVLGHYLEVAKLAHLGASKAPDFRPGMLYGEALSYTVRANFAEAYGPQGPLNRPCPMCPHPRHLSLALRCALAAVIFPLGALGQTPRPPETPSPSEVNLARESFRAGVAAVREGRWELALRAFQQSYALYPQPLTLLNIAGAQVETGHLVLGSESYRSFIAQATAPPASEHREQALEALSRAERRVAHAALDVIGLESADQLSLDGRPIGRAAVGTSLPIDPGAHVFSVRRDGVEAGRVELTFAAGDLQRVTLAVRPRTLVGLDPVGPAGPAPRRGGLLRSPWFWTTVGVVIVGGAVSTYVLATQSTPEGFSGNLPPGRVSVQ